MTRITAYISFSVYTSETTIFREVYTMQKQKPLWSLACLYWWASFMALLCLFLLEKILLQSNVNSPLLIGSFGASAVLLFGAPQSPFSHPRNVIGGHVFSAFIGVTMYTLLGSSPILAASLAVSTSIAVMYLSNTLHPPGGATAFIAVMGSHSIHELGYMYVLIPCALGSVLLCILAYINRYLIALLSKKSM